MKNLEIARYTLLYVIRRSGIIWAQIVLNPTVKTYRRISWDSIAQKPESAFRWAYGWIHFTVLIIYISFLWNPYQPQLLDIVLDLLSLLLVSTIFLLLLVIYVGATQFIATRWFGGKGNFSKTLFIFSGLISALLTPFWFIKFFWVLLSIVLEWLEYGIPFLSSISSQGFILDLFKVLSIVAIILYIQALRGIHRISFFRTIITIFLSLITLSILGYVVLDLFFFGFNI